MATITATPQTALIDEVVALKIAGLQRDQHITVVASVIGDGGDEFYSYAHYTADYKGRADLSQDPSTGGMYFGTQPMGLFCTMLPSPANKRAHRRFLVRDVEAPVCFVVSVYGTHLLYEDISVKSRFCSVIVRRFYVAPGVHRIPVREGRLRGTVFIPNGEGPFPAVVDLFGTAGGLMEFRAALLASRGFVALSLAYFDYEDLPDTVFDIELEYFEEAKNFLLAQNKVSGKCGVGIIGVSTGGTLALAAASYVPGYKCCISINGPVFCYYATMYYKGRIWKATFPDMRWAHVQDGSIALRRCLDDVFESGIDSDSVIEFQKSKNSFLFIFSEDDMAIESRKHKQYVEELFKGSDSDYRICFYQGAGHLVEPPFSAHAAQTYAKIINLPQKWGGNPKDHAVAQLGTWNEMLTFLKTKLQPTRSLAKL